MEHDLANRPPDGRRLSFPREHRLKRRRLIRPLFERGRDDVGTLAVGSIRLLYRVAAREEAGAEVPLQIGFSPGRRARPAVVRNRVRRLLREVYRVNQLLLIDLFSNLDDVLTVMVLFRGDPEQAGPSIHRDLPEALRRLHRRLSASGEGSSPAETAD